MDCQGGGVGTGYGAYFNGSGMGKRFGRQGKMVMGGLAGSRVGGKQNGEEDTGIFLGLTV